MTPDIVTSTFVVNPLIAAFTTVGVVAGLPDGLFSNRKSQVCVDFGGPLNGKRWCIL
jgi:hypothetical protein